MGEVRSEIQGPVFRFWGLMELMLRLLFLATQPPSRLAEGICVAIENEKLFGEPFLLIWSSVFDVSNALSH